MQELENVNWRPNQFSNIGYCLVTNEKLAGGEMGTSNVEQKLPQTNSGMGQIDEAIRDRTLAPVEESIP